ncbi:MAG: hypothetical protein R3F61_18545 [Myxococcota bacterium]
MLFALVLACSSPAPEPAPPEPPSLDESLAELRRTVGRAGRDDALACAAVELANQIAPTIDAAVTSGELDWEAARTSAPGLVKLGDHIVVDYKELSLAVGPGAASTALVTVGGAHQSGCVDPVRLDRWMQRGPTVNAAPACMVPILKRELAREIDALVGRCLCTLPETDPTPALAERLDRLELTETASRVRAWPSAWAPCETPTEPTAP